jgi:hypothetical protein
MATSQAWRRWLLPAAAVLLLVTTALAAAPAVRLAWRLRWQWLPAAAAAELFFYLLYFRRRYRWEMGATSQ